MLVQTRGLLHLPLKTFKHFFLRQFQAVVVLDADLFQRDLQRRALLCTRFIFLALLLERLHPVKKPDEELVLLLVQQRRVPHAPKYRAKRALS